MREKEREISECKTERRTHPEKLINIAADRKRLKLVYHFQIKEKNLAKT